MKQEKLLQCIKYSRFLLEDAVRCIDSNTYAKLKLLALDDYLMNLYYGIHTEDNILQKFLTLNPQFAKKDGSLSKQKKAVEMYEEFKKKEVEL